MTRHPARYLLRRWWHRQQRPTAASTARIVDVRRPHLTPAAALFIAWLASLAIPGALWLAHLPGPAAFTLAALGIAAGMGLWTRDA